ncbi:MAG TPA: 6-pyruvoyl-tetrahydropterin synthase-related protein [Pyrinomonadaceae bacterium]|nr:6-pyruvoyl-tetrahydropterin synthase-related protein [Pyrinomonadaceae bacterium]
MLHADERRRIDYRILVVIVAGLLVALPCLLYGFPFYGDDSVWNAIFYQEFSRLFWSGDVYPRWLAGLNGGLGDPTGYYYAPFAYWLTSLLSFLFHDDPLGWRQLGLSTAVAVAASGLTAYFWLKRIVSERAALIASLTYLLLPYHASVDVYVRGALAETWTFVWMPLVLSAVDRMFTRRRYSVPLLAVSYAALILTHLPTTLLFSLVPVAYSFYLAPAGLKRRSLLLTVAGMMLGVGLAAIYLVPALAMQEFVFHTTEGIGGHYYFGNWFLFTQLRWLGRGSDYFMAAVGAVLLAVLGFLVAFKGLNGQLKRSATFWLAIALCSFVMMTPFSKWIWHLLPTLQKVQFPFRFNTVLSLAVAALTAFAVAACRREKASFVFVVVGVLLTGAWTYTLVLRSYYAYPAHYIDRVFVDSVKKRLEQRRDTNEFRPRWVVSIEENELENLLRHIGQSGDDLTKVKLKEGQGAVTVVKWTAREILLRSESPNGGTITVSRFYFPGWYFQVDSGEPQAVEPSKPAGLIAFKVPAGAHQIALQLGRRRAEIAGIISSVVSLICVLLLLVAPKIIAHRNGKG